jgi:PncC family amidohydrolase
MTSMKDLDNKSSELGDLLKSHNMTFAAAESCTGGLLGHVITNIPGSSKYFLGSAVTYSDDSKEVILGVGKDTLKESGAVSSECVQEMAIGVRDVFHSDIGMAISGIAGPGGGTDEKPVGTVFIAMADKNSCGIFKFLFQGDRGEIKEQTCLKAIDLIIEKLQSGL